MGDCHIPHKSSDIPEQFKSLLVPGKLDYVICTGNICNAETKTWIESLSPSKDSSVFVSGDADEVPGLSERQCVTIGGFKFGIIHGHQVVPWGDLEALGTVQRELECDVLIFGHTHTEKILAQNGIFFLNPGSITGAYSILSRYH